MTDTSDQDDVDANNPRSRGNYDRFRNSPWYYVDDDPPSVGVTVSGDELGR